MEQLKSRLCYKYSASKRLEGQRQSARTDGTLPEVDVVEKEAMQREKVLRWREQE